MRRLLCLLAALCLLAGCAAPAAPVEQPVQKPAAQQPAEEAPTETAPANRQGNDQGSKQVFQVTVIGKEVSYGYSDA